MQRWLAYKSMEWKYKSAPYGNVFAYLQAVVSPPNSLHLKLSVYSALLVNKSLGSSRGRGGRPVVLAKPLSASRKFLRNK